MIIKHIIQSGSESENKIVHHMNYLMFCIYLWYIYICCETLPLLQIRLICVYMHVGVNENLSLIIQHLVVTLS